MADLTLTLSVVGESGPLPAPVAIGETKTLRVLATDGPGGAALAASGVTILLTQPDGAQVSITPAAGATGTWTAPVVFDAVGTWRAVARATGPDSAASGDLTQIVLGSSADVPLPVPQIQTIVQDSGQYRRVSLVAWATALGIAVSATNLSPALQAMLNAFVPGAVPSLDGYEVVPPPGISYCQDQLIFPDGCRNVRMVSFPGVTSIRKTYSTSFFANPNRNAARDDRTKRPTDIHFQGFDLGADYVPKTGYSYGDEGSYLSGPGGEMVGGFYADRVTLLDMTITGTGANSRAVAPVGSGWYGDNINIRASREGEGTGGVRVNTADGVGHIFRRVYGYSGDDFLQVVINVNDAIAGYYVTDVLFEDCVGYSTNARGMIVGLGEQGFNDPYADYFGRIGTVIFRNCAIRGGTINAKFDIEAEGWIDAIIVENCRVLPADFGIPVDWSKKTDGIQINTVRLYDADPDRPSIGLLKIDGWHDECFGKSAINVNRTQGLGREYKIRTMTRTGGVVTVRLDRAHDKLIGDSITVDEAATAGFNGTFVITGVPDSTGMTWAQAGADETAAEVSANLRGYVLAPYSVAQQAVANARWQIGRLVLLNGYTGKPQNWRPLGLEADGVTPRASNADPTKPGAADTEAIEIRGARQTLIENWRLETAPGQKGITCGRIEKTGSVVIGGDTFVDGIEVAPRYPADPLGNYPALTTDAEVSGIFVDEAESVRVDDAVRITPASATPNNVLVPIRVTAATRRGASDVRFDVDLSAWPAAHPTFIGGPAGSYTLDSAIYPVGYVPAVDDLAATLTSAGVVGNAITWTATDRLIRYTSANTAVTIHTINASPALSAAGNVTLAVTATGGTVLLRKYDGTAGNLRIPHDILIRTNEAVTLAPDPVGGFYTLAGPPKPLELRASTTSGTGVRLTSDAAAATTWNSFPVALGQAFAVQLLVSARQTGGTSGTTGDHATWRVDCSVRRQGGVGSVVVNGGGSSIAPTTSDAAAAGWRLAVAADTTNGALAVTGTGEANKTITWTATVQYVQAQ